MSTIIFFDFDYTMIDCNSDTWVFERLSPEIATLQKQLRKKIQWTELMQQLLYQLACKGYSVSQIEKCISTCPMHIKMVELLKKLGQQKATIYIVSDANHLFIEWILKAYGVDKFVTKVITNPAEIVKKENVEYLHVKKYSDVVKHSCTSCAVNICKGEIVEKLINDKNKVVYVGDGRNDFCGAKRLKNTDVVFARKGFALLKKIEEQGLNAQVCGWENYEELYDLFHKYNIIQ